VHAQGGKALEYRAFVPYFGPDQPLYGLAPRGLDGRLPPHDRVEDMAAHYVAEIRDLQPHGPYYLGGWSFGGAIAFEMARQLQAAGERVAFLALFDTWGRPWDLQQAPSGTSLRFLWQRLGFHLAALGRLERGFRSRYFLRKGARPSVDPAEGARILRVDQAVLVAPVTPPSSGCCRHRRAAGAYRLSLIGVNWSCSGPRAWLTSLDDPYLGWSDVAGSTSTWSKSLGPIARFSARSRTSALSPRE
jgi:pimeloyl-ACP methyl ester carboxylesterase